jgi:hypothetical protein
MISKMPTCYIASPYTIGDKDENVLRQIDAYFALMLFGFCPYAPLLSHFVNKSYQIAYEDWMRLDMTWIDRCDILLRLPGESRGADREVAHAIEAGIPVCNTISEVYTYARESGWL